VHHRLHQCAPGTTVAIGEGVDGLELGVRDRYVCQRDDVGAGDEGDQVSDGPRDPLVVRGYEVRSRGRDVRAADPHLLGAPTAACSGSSSRRSAWCDEHADRRLGILART
jgi:hypothetical protein